MTYNERVLRGEVFGPVDPNYFPAYYKPVPVTFPSAMQTVVQSVFAGDSKTIAQGGIDKPLDPSKLVPDLSIGTGGGMLSIGLIAVIVLFLVFIIKGVLGIFK